MWHASCGLGHGALLLLSPSPAPPNWPYKSLQNLLEFFKVSVSGFQRNWPEWSVALCCASPFTCGRPRFIQVPSVLIFMFHVNVITNGLISLCEDFWSLGEVFLNKPRSEKLVSLMKNENTQPHIYTNLPLGWLVCFGFFLIVAYLKCILLMAASETALYRIIGENSFLVIYVKMNWLFSVYAQLNFLGKQYWMN